MREGRLFFPEVPLNQWHQVDDALAVRMIPVPHRPEYSDTVAFMFRGPSQSLLYLPDIDSWDRWDIRVDDIVREVDVALLDGAFFSPDEVPGRSIEDIPHPLMRQTMDRLAAAVQDGNRVVFTHLNNTNPALDDGGDAAREVARRGFEIARAGLRFPL